MKKLDKLIIKSYLGPLLLTFSISVFVLLLQFLWMKIEQIVGKGLETTVIIELVVYACATLVPMALPLAILLASIMTIGNFGERYELVAMKSAGLPLFRILRPLIVLSLVLSVFAFFFSNNVIPVANMKLRTILYEVKTKKPTLNIKPNQFYSEIDNYTIRIGSKDKEGKNLKDIIIYDHSEDLGNVNVTIADRGQMYSTNDGNVLIFHLFDGYTFDEDLSGENTMKRPLVRLEFKEQILNFDISNFAYQKTDENRYEGHYKMLNIMDLNRSLDTLQSNSEQFVAGFVRTIGRDLNFNVPTTDYKGNFYDDYSRLDSKKKTEIDNLALSKIEYLESDLSAMKSKIRSDKSYITRYKIELHRKFTLSVACLILFFMGAPLGALIRKGGLGMPVVVSTLAFIVYHILGTMGENAALEGKLPVWLGMWLSSVVFLPLGVFLTMKATSDASVLSAETWTKYFDSFVQKIKERKRKV